MSGMRRDRLGDDGVVYRCAVLVGEMGFLARGSAAKTVCVIASAQDKLIERTNFLLTIS